MCKKGAKNIAYYKTTFKHVERNECIYLQNFIYSDDDMTHIHQCSYEIKTSGIRV